MLHGLTKAPFFVSLMGIGAVCMLVPALHALAFADFRTARIFLYGSILSAFLTLLIGLATANYAPRSVPRSQLTTLLAAFSILPLLLAVPFYEVARPTSLIDAWFEMVSSFTTTGATLYENAGRLNPSLHLWRALVGWLGGLLVWITAVAVLAPMNLGGFEVRAASATGDNLRLPRHLTLVTDPSERLLRISVKLVPIYSGLTALLWLGLVIAGEVPFVAICHAMAVISTSGISPVGGVQNAGAGLMGEVLIGVFFLLALSRLTFSFGIDRTGIGAVWTDPELRLGLSIAGFVTAILFLRHYVLPESSVLQTGLMPAVLALWGTFFTVLSFLTTTGFESAHWLAAKDWAGLQSPGLILLGLALIGGGVATTAGGVKLLRIYALSKHGLRELERIVHPHSLGGAGQDARRIRRQGAYIAWVFFMLFATSVAVVMLALSLVGLQFEPAMVLTISALTTTGPLAEVAGENPASFAGIPDAAKMILAATMVLGRMETLALVALFNPEFWRS